MSRQHSPYFKIQKLYSKISLPPLISSLYFLPKRFLILCLLCMLLEVYIYISRFLIYSPSHSSLPFHKWYDSVYCLFLIFRERKGDRQREGNHGFVGPLIHWSILSCVCPDWGANPQRTGLYHVRFRHQRTLEIILYEFIESLIFLMVGLV